MQTNISELFLDNPDVKDAETILRTCVHCGFCTPGMVLSAVNLLKNNPHPTEFEIREAIAGNLCRCSGYQQIVDAIRSVVLPRLKAAKLPIATASIKASRKADAMSSKVAGTRSMMRSKAARPST